MQPYRRFDKLDAGTVITTNGIERVEIKLPFIDEDNESIAFKKGDHASCNGQVRLNGREYLILYSGRNGCRYLVPVEVQDKVCRPLEAIVRI